MKNKAIKTLAAVGFVAAGALSAAAPGFAAAATSGGLVQNYTFEENPVTNPSGFQSYYAGTADTLNDWTVTTGNIDVFANTFFTMPAGLPSTAQGIDLNGSGTVNTMGAIEQTLTGLAENTQYIVHFQASAHACDGEDPEPKTAIATVNGVQVQQSAGDGSIAIDATSVDNTTNNTAWQDRAFVFNTGAGQTTATIGFAATSTGSCGILLTAISASSVGAAPLLAPVVVGSSLAAAGLVGTVVWMVRRRRAATV